MCSLEQFMGTDNDIKYIESAFLNTHFYVTNITNNHHDHN